MNLLPPELESLNLYSYLKRLGTPKLSALIGNERIEAIHEIVSKGITEKRLVSFLDIRYGTQILAQKDIRKALLPVLPPSFQHFILYGTQKEESSLPPGELNNLISLHWRRKSKTTQRTLAVFDLSDEFLPPVPDKISSIESILPEKTLYPYQLRVKDKFVRSLINGDERILVHMPTGAGKTRTCIEGIIDYWRSFASRSGYFVWLAHSEELCEQAVETFKKIWESRGDFPINIYRMWGSNEMPDLQEGNGFIVASLQSLHAMRTTASDETFKVIAALKSKCQLIVIDEAHKCIAPTYKASIEFIANIDKTKIVGLTATPGRGSDNVETKELVEFFHNNKISLTSASGTEIDNPIKFLQDRDYLAHITRRPISTNVSLDLNEKERNFIATFLDLPTSVLEKLATNAERNALILGEIAALCANGRHIIVFALSVEHAHLIAELLNLNNIKARSIDGGSTAFDRKKYIEDYKTGKINVLVNYGVLTTGFDAPNTNAVVITRPTGSLVLYSQMIGRGIRGPKMGGNPECILVDLKDNLVGFPDEKQAFTYFNNEWA